MQLNEKGFTYIIIVVILISLITVLVLLIRDSPHIETISYNLTDNYKNELNYLLSSSFTTTDLNNFNSEFYNFTRSHNYEASICTIIDNGDYIYISNYTGETKKGINNKDTIQINRTDNPGDISLGNCVVDYNSEQKVSYYLEITNEKSKDVSYVKGNNINDTGFVFP